MLDYHPTPIQEIESGLLSAAGVRLLVKREDLNHPFISGNKWWKLKYNLLAARYENHHTLLTFGGAFSSHIYATAAAARETGFKSIGVIRGEETLPLNPTLRFACDNGMMLHYISRAAYRTKTQKEFIDDLHKRFGRFYMIPEGGTNLLAMRGTREFASVLEQTDFDNLFLPVGTGGTMAGIISGFKGRRFVTGVSVLKNGEFLTDEIKNLTVTFCDHVYPNWNVVTSYDHGGYAKVTPALLNFVHDKKVHHNLPLDAVYTGKMFWAIMEEVRKGSFKGGTTILAVHTGGLQGAAGLINQFSVRQ